MLTQRRRVVKKCRAVGRRKPHTRTGEIRNAGFPASGFEPRCTSLSCESKLVMDVTSNFFVRLCPFQELGNGKTFGEINTVFP